MARTRRTPKSGSNGAYNLAVDTAPTTGSSFRSLSNNGVSVLTTAANTWTLQAPEPGCIKYLVSVGVSSAARVVKLDSPATSAGSVTVGPTASSFRKLTFNSTDVMTVALLGINTTRWQVLYATTGQLTVGTTAIVAGTS